ncbi:type II toxin-antitoxin system HicB family antitoxin [Dehalogenimonas etheniformans]|uniref:Type II toxin-antitoxin system HicB family antitoxin n=1 Tax=Dehalogenimonas etheniformans TaxID=1536648 RepID=A0A2P5P6G9_9CHLR|nr:type II toxin-antitoxin system HicB family antitoxin [Dehalogenimonas etheniformans]QNT75462.1 type II toxin-antitoxin system HicB family antitoxin [Dehalogenimonas etheniformans]
MTPATERKPLEYYLDATYPVTIEAAPEGGYFAQIEDLPGCYSQGETVEEAIQMIEEARRLWLEVACEEGIDIPEPRSGGDYSGKILLRAPKNLHRALGRIADKEGVSLNQYLVATLSKAVGVYEGSKRASQPLEPKVVERKGKARISATSVISRSGSFRGKEQVVEPILKKVQ